MTTWPYDPSPPSGDWQVTLPGGASIGELLVYQSTAAVPSGVLIPSSTGASAVVHRLSGTGGIGSVYRLRAHFGSGVAVPTLPYSGLFSFNPIQAKAIMGGLSAGLSMGETGSIVPASPPNLIVNSVTVTRPRAGAIEIQFTVASESSGFSGSAGWLDGTLGGYAYWARCDIYHGAGGAPWLQTTHRPDTGDPETSTGGVVDGYFACLTGPDWPYPYFTGGTPAP